MESLGGDQRWWVRFLAQHSAIVYYLVLNHLWALSPTLAYKFSELLEGHAVNTYGQFLDENEELLKTLPPSRAAIDYYSFGFADPLFGEYQTSALASGADVSIATVGCVHASLYLFAYFVASYYIAVAQAR
jgi:ubiquinol oxidase